MDKKTKFVLLIGSILVICSIYGIYINHQIQRLEGYININNEIFEITADETINNNKIIDVSNELSSKVENIKLKGIQNININIVPLIDNNSENYSTVRYTTKCTYKLNILGFKFNRNYETSPRTFLVRKV